MSENTDLEALMRKHAERMSAPRRALFQSASRSNCLARQVG